MYIDPAYKFALVLLRYCATCYMNTAEREMQYNRQKGPALCGACEVALAADPFDPMLMLQR